MLFNVLLILHIVVCLALVGIILAQSGKAGNISSMFGGGGGGESFLGATGASKLFAKITTGLAVTFMVLCLTLAILSTKRYVKSDVTGDTKVVETEIPAPGTTPIQPEETTTPAPVPDTKDQPAETPKTESNDKTPENKDSTEENK
jgi:preprotein translocase subunit SecG